ncbi:hypothetical protein BKI52_28230 [marine bacterium AO1-C]|nr:hypothetical protein BKI52_28230 [marine bacterium AO1-C]
MDNRIFESDKFIIDLSWISSIKLGLFNEENPSNSLNVIQIILDSQEMLISETDLAITGKNNSSLEKLYEKLVDAWKKHLNSLAELQQ